MTLAFWYQSGLWNVLIPVLTTSVLAWHNPRVQINPPYSDNETLPETCINVAF